MGNTHFNKPQVITLDTPYPVGAVHIYTLRTVGGPVLFDAGPPTSSAFDILTRKIDFKKLKYLLITHCHADHYGLAYKIERITSAKIVISRNDIKKHKEGEKRIKLTKEIFKSLGFPQKELIEVENVVKGFLINFPENPIPLEDIADELKDIGITYIHCGGHSSDDIIYLYNQYAISGDVLLKDIFQTPLIDVDMEKNERFRSYEAYCESIKKLIPLKKHTILPGHREVKNIDEIVEFYVTKMFTRIIAIKECFDSCSIYETVKKIVKDNDPFKKFIKAGEITFFNDFLHNPQLLKESLEMLGIFSKVSQLYNKAIL